MDLSIDASRLHDRVRLQALLNQQFEPEVFWDAVKPLVDSAPQLLLTEIGRSVQGRPLRLVRFGSGPRRVLIWSQMHGDEPTGTMALGDLLQLLSTRPDDDRVRRWCDDLTLLIIPILNPDGASLKQRRNAQGIDMNRDSRAMTSPEVRALDRVQREERPEFALTLHDEDAKTRVGKTERMSAISLLAPSVDEMLRETPARLRAKGLCCRIAAAIRPLVGDHVARFEDRHTPLSLGGMLQERGTATVLVETGWWPEDPELQFLRKVNFVGLLGALDALAAGDVEPVELDEYQAIPENDRGVFDVLIRGGRVVLPGAEPFVTEIGIDFDEPLELRGGHVSDLGDLAGYSARDILIAEGFFIHPHQEALKTRVDGTSALDEGRPASFTIRKGEAPDSEAVWIMERGVARRADGPTPGETPS